MRIEPVVYERKDLFATDHADTMVNRAEWVGNTEPHVHDFIEIAMVAGGSGRHFSANGERDLHAGDVIVIRPGAWHSYTRCAGLIIHNCCFSLNLLVHELGWLREDPALNYLFWAGPLSGSRWGVLPLRLPEKPFTECLESLDELRRVQDSPRRTIQLGRLLIFLDSLSRAVEAVINPNQLVKPLHPAVLETVRLLESEPERPWSLGELAACVHLHPSYLVRLFKADTGLSPMAYLTRCRVENAAGLLLHTRIPISEIAAQVGWFDANLFARHFRAAYGISATEYRSRFTG